ncbi:MAG: transcriptional regulator [Saprospirales bacterium]|nr:transcriptional regulator [Saprospirales bacterium]
MKSKTISYRSAQLLSQLRERDAEYFSLETARNILQGSSGKAVRELVRNMVNRGLLLRIKDGLFHVIPYEADSDLYFPNWHQMAQHLAEGRAYYIGYFSALQVHGLTTQPSMREQVVVDQQVKPSNIRVRDVAFQFIYHNERHFFGYQPTWIDDFHKVLISDPEKTIIDCLYEPVYAGGIQEIAKALFKARNDLDIQKLSDYLDRFGAQSVRKRLGFLLDGFGILPAFAERLQKSLSLRLYLLTPAFPRKESIGRNGECWTNEDEQTIFSSINT